MKNFLLFCMLLFVFSCGKNEDHNSGLNDLTSLRSSGLFANCPTNPCPLCNNIHLEILYCNGECLPVVGLRFVDTGNGNCPGKLTIDWGDGTTPQVITNCFNMTCANNYTSCAGSAGIYKNYAASVKDGTCTKFLIKTTYEYDSSCSTCYGGLSGNSACNPLNLCLNATVCNFDDPNGSLDCIAN